MAQRRNPLGGIPGRGTREPNPGIFPNLEQFQYELAQELGVTLPGATGPRQDEFLGGDQLRRGPLVLREESSSR